MKSRHMIRYLSGAIIAFFICIGYIWSEDYKSMDCVQAIVNGDMLSFSEDSGFYDGPLSVSLIKNIEVPGVARIFYTLDGNDPTVESMEYTKPIFLKKRSDYTVYSLKAVIYYGEKYSDIYEKTYILSDDVSNKYDINIVSITSDKNNLYDYETGILVPGKTYDDNYAKNGTGPYIEGNYNQRNDEWIRRGHMTMFNSEGELLADQNVGIGVSGGTSAANEVKSLKICADKTYDKENKKLRLDLRSEGTYSSTYSFIDEYNSIRLRSGGQDIYFGNIRSAVISRLVQSSGFDHCSSTNRCVVYLNGKYYGIYDIQQNYSASYIADRFNLKESELIEKKKGDEFRSFSEAGIHEYFNTDLNDPVNREILEQYVDMGSYLSYYAINILCNNTDWPGNNFEMWRYTGEKNVYNPYSDGRYRFLIYDTDVTFNTDSTWNFFEGSQSDTFISLMEGLYRGTDSTFSKVMTSSYYRDQFVTMICDLMNTSFSTENILKIINEENEKIEAVREMYFDKEDVKSAEIHVDQIRQAALKRPDEIADSFFRYFGLVEKYELNLTSSEGLAINWNSMKLPEKDGYRNQYYKGVRMTLNQEAYPGYSFQYWLVNGNKVYDRSVEITEEMLIDGKINIQGVAARNEFPEVIVSEISARGSADWIRISNAGGEPAYLNQYYLSDEENNLMKYQMPDTILEPGSSVIIYGSKNYHSVGDYICNFSLSEDEILYLSDGKNCLYSHFIPKMSNIETYGRYKNSNDWRFMADNMQED